MLVKKFLHILLTGLLSFFILACEDDSVPMLADIEDPTVLLINPTQPQLDVGFVQGNTITLGGTISDQSNLKSINLSIKAPGAAMPWFKQEWTDIVDTDPEHVFNIEETVIIPDDAALGTHTLTISAVDEAENLTTVTYPFDVVEPNVRLVVTVPPSTPEGAEIYVVGTFTDNGDIIDFNPLWRLTESEDGTFIANLFLPVGIEQRFKFRILSDTPVNPWLFVETDAECTEVAERTVVGLPDLQLLDLNVENWDNLGVCDL